MSPHPAHIRRLPAILATFLALALAAGPARATKIARASDDLRLGSRVIGTLRPGEERTYRLVIDASGAIAIRMEKVLDAEIDPRLVLRNANGEDIGEDDDGGGDLNALLAATLEPGMYTIVATAVGASSGDFVLRVEEQRVIDIAPGAAILGTFGEGAGQARFAVELARPTALRIRVSPVLGSDVDPKVTLIGPTGATLGSDDDGGGNLSALLAVDAAVGTHTIVVDRVGSSTGRFLLVVADHNAPIAGIPLAVGDRATGSVGDALVPAAHVLRVPAGGQDVRLTVRAARLDRARAAEPQLDPCVVVLDREGAIVDSDDDGGGGDDAMVRLPLGGGEYRVLVGAAGETIGGYEIVAEADALPALALGEEVSGRLSAGGRELYRIVAARPMEIAVSVRKAEGSGLDPRVEIIGPDGVSLGNDDDSGGENDAFLVASIPAGRHAVVVTAYGSTEGGYIVSAREFAMVDRGAITPDDRRTASLETSGDRHAWRLRIDRPTSVTIDLESAAFDAKLSLRDDTGAEIASDDDGGDETNARISRRLPAGAYAIVAMSYDGGTGPYALAVASFAAGTVEVGMRQLGTIRESGKEAHYAYAVAERQAVVIRAEKVLDSALDPVVTLTNDAGTEVATDDDGGDGLNARIRQILAPGTYDIAVRGVGSSTGDFVLSVERAVEAAPADLRPIAIGERRVGRISSEEQVDRYPLVLAEAANIVARLDKLGGSELDPKLAIETDAGAEIAADDDGGEGTNARVYRHLPAGRYAVVARSYGSTAGEYVLAVDIDRYTIHEIGTLTDERTADGRIATPGERIAWAFSLGARTPFTASMEKIGGEIDPVLTLTTRAGEQVATDDDGGDGNDALIEQALDPGDYVVFASGYDGKTGDFRLTLRTGERPVADHDHGVIAPGESREGTLAGGPGRERDRYRLVMTARAPVTIRLDTAAGSALDPYLRLLDDKGREIATDDDGGDGTNALIRRELDLGAYTIVAESYARTSGTYRLTVEGPAGNVRVLTFADGDHGFGRAADAREERSLVVGKYSVRAIRGDRIVVSNALGRFSDGSFAVTAVRIAGPAAAGYGLAIRADGDRAYIFEIDGSGRFRFRRADRRSSADLIPWTATTTIAKGDYAQNVLRIRAAGPEFVLSLNGTEVGRASDGTLAAGNVGLSVGEGLHVLFDDLELPEGPQAGGR